MRQWYVYLKTYWLPGFVLGLSALLGLSFSWYMHRHQLSSVPSGVPKGTITIKTFHYPISFIDQLKGDPHAGEKIFAAYCHSCHAIHPIIPIHAPRINDRKAWLVIQKQGLKQLTKIAAKGIAAMPARGGCFECSDAQLTMTIRYMIETALSHKRTYH